VIPDLNLEIAYHEFRRLCRPFRLRQVHAAPDYRRLEPITAAKSISATGVSTASRQQQRDNRHGVPGLRALSAYARLRQHCPLRSAERTPKAEIDARVKLGGGAAAYRAVFGPQPRNCPAASASAWRWDAPSCAIPRRSCSTSRFPTSMQSCAGRCAPNQGIVAGAEDQRWSSSPTIISRP